MWCIGQPAVGCFTSSGVIYWCLLASGYAIIIAMSSSWRDAFLRLHAEPWRRRQRSPVILETLRLLRPFHRLLVAEAEANSPVWVRTFRGWDLIRRKTDGQGCEEHLHLPGGQWQRARTWPWRAPGKSVLKEDGSPGGRHPGVSRVTEISRRLGIRGSHYIWSYVVVRDNLWYFKAVPQQTCGGGRQVPAS